MKTKLSIITILLSVSFAVVAQTWEYVNTLQNEWLTKVCTQGLDTVYIVGRDGLIAKSTDRALTWTKQHVDANITLNDVIFVNHETGYAIGTNGTILKTTDAGVNWIALNSGTTTKLNAIAATGYNNIWIVGDNGTVLYSLNAGNTWLTKGLTVTSNFNDISFKNEIGYIVGNDSTYYKTTDSGSIWIKNKFNINREKLLLDSFNLYSICQISNNHTYVLYGINDRPLCINFDNQFLMDTPDMTSFATENDSIGYGVWANTTSNGDHIMKIYKMKNGNYLEETRLYPQNNHIDYTHSDIVIINDTTGYVLSGNFLYKISKKIINKVDENKYQSKIVIKQIGSDLSINSVGEDIECIEIYNVSGARIIHIFGLKQKSKLVAISHLGSGTYLVRSVFSDNRSCITKWIKE